MNVTLFILNDFIVTESVPLVSFSCISDYTSFAYMSLWNS